MSKLEIQIAEADFYELNAETESPAKGYVDVKFILNADADKDNFVIVRTIYTDDQMTVRDVQSEARHSAIDVLKRVLELAEPLGMTPELRQRWR